MKTQINQLITIVSFFTISIGTTLGISWGMSAIVYDKNPMPKKQIILKAHQHVNIDISKPLRMLLPKSAPSSTR